MELLWLIIVIGEIAASCRTTGLSLHRFTLRPTCLNVRIYTPPEITSDKLVVRYVTTNRLFAILVIRTG